MAYDFRENGIYGIKARRVIDPDKRVKNEVEISFNTKYLGDPAEEFFQGNEVMVVSSLSREEIDRKIAEMSAKEIEVKAAVKELKNKQERVPWLGDEYHRIDHEIYEKKRETDGFDYLKRKLTKSVTMEEAGVSKECLGLFDQLTLAGMKQKPGQESPYGYDITESVQNCAVNMNDFVATVAKALEKYNSGESTKDLFDKYDDFSKSKLDVLVSDLDSLKGMLDGFDKLRNSIKEKDGRTFTPELVTRFTEKAGEIKEFVGKIDIPGKSFEDDLNELKCSMDNFSDSDKCDTPEETIMTPVLVEKALDDIARGIVPIVKEED